MQVIVESTQGLGRTMTITLAAEQVEQAVDAELQRRAVHLRINGFRPGKVPMTIVKQQLGDSVRQTVCNELMHRHFEEAIAQQALHPAGRVKLTPQALRTGEDFSYQVAFEIYPQITLHGLKDMVVERPQAEVSDDDLEAMLLRLRRHMATWHPVERAAKIGDRVTINFSGTIAGESFEEGSASNFVLILGENDLVAGFNEGIIGHKVADEFTIDITFPALSAASFAGAEDLQNKTAQFSILLNQVEECVLPEWRPEIIKQFGVVDGQLDSLKHTVRVTMCRVLQRAIKRRVTTQIFNGLLERHANLAIPESLIDQALEHHAAMHGEQSMVQLPSDQNLLDAASPIDRRRALARQWVVIQLLLGEVMKQQALQLDSSQVDQVLEEMSLDYTDPEQMISRYRNDRELMKNIHAMALEAQAIDSLLADVTVIEKPLGFSELVN